MCGVDPDVPGRRLVEDRRVDPKTVVIRLELHPFDDSVSGRATDASGAARDFVGLMGLVAAVEALVPWGSRASETEAP
jgi:hypothetical protein